MFTKDDRFKFWKVEHVVMLENIDVKSKVDKEGKYLFTPFDLTGGMVSQIINVGGSLADKKILVVDTVEMIPVLLVMGAVKANITYVAPYAFKGEVATRIGVTVVQDSILTWKTDMKFDVVIGNPPYQRNDGSSHKLWPEFTVNAIELLADNGFLAFVTPNSWAYKPEAQKFKAVVSQLKTGNLISANLSTSRDYFPGVGEDIGAWLWQKTTYQGSTTFSRDRVTKTVNWCGHTITFTDSEELVIRLSNKIIQHSDLRHKGYADFGGDRNTKSLIADGVVSDSKDFEHPIGVFWSGSQRKFAKTADVRHGWKVIVNRSGYYYDPEQPNKYIQHSDTLGVGQLAIGIACENETECLQIMSYLKSKLYVWFMRANKTNGFNEHFRKLPKLENKMWTDDELYSHFGLTQEEIEFVESSVK